jgi:heme/copper-type cytochrome/quinol oxidase subunit 3
MSTPSPAVTSDTSTETTARPLVTAIDDRLGTRGMLLFIATEAMLFVLLFFSYYYLAHGNWVWSQEKPPKLLFAIPLLLILLTSSGVLHWGETQVRQHAYGRGRIALAVTIALGLVFLVLQGFEYRDHLKTLTPATDAYGSIFYAITTTHALHVVVGLCMLSYVLLLPQLEPTDRPPHRPLHNATLYWHFVDVVWVVVVSVLYILPNLVQA